MWDFSKRVAVSHEIETKKSHLSYRGFHKMC